MDMIATTFDIACSFRGMETAFRGSHGYDERASVVGDLSGAQDIEAERRTGLVHGFPDIAVLPDRPPNGREISTLKSTLGTLEARKRRATEPAASAATPFGRPGPSCSMMQPTRSNKPDGYLLGSYRIATAPEPNSSRLMSFKSTRFDSAANNVGPWPASLGCTTNSYSSINP